MTDEPGFLEPALQEWRNLDAQTRDKFKSKAAGTRDGVSAAV